MIPALLHMTLQNCKVTLRHRKLTKSKSSIFHTSFCVYILMKTKPLDANTSSMHERGSQPPAHQGSMENTDDASPSSSDNTDKAAVPSNKDNANENDVPSNSDNSTPKDAVSSDPGTDEESNSS